MSPSPAVRREFSRVIGRDELAAAPLSRSIEATAAERAALAERFGLVALGDLRAKVEIGVGQGSGNLFLSGRLWASVTQRCVVTLEPIGISLDEHFDTFVTLEPVAPTPGGATERFPEIDLEAPEIIGPEGLDVGELVAQHLLLSLDPYPRAPSATLEQVWPIEAARAPADWEDSPFAALRRLREKP